MTLTTDDKPSPHEIALHVSLTQQNNIWHNTQHITQPKRCRVAGSPVAPQEISVDTLLFISVTVSVITRLQEKECTHHAYRHDNTNEKDDDVNNH